MTLKIDRGGEVTFATRPRVECTLTECVVGAAAGKCALDLTWLDGVPGLRRVTFREVTFCGLGHSPEDLRALVDGREEAVVIGCRHCGCPVDGSEGASGVCPEDLSYRCVMTA